MAKDFFQDILPKDDPRPPKRPEPSQVIQGDEVEVPETIEVEQERPPERSIRNINVNRPRPAERPIERPSMDRREVPPVGGGLPKPKRSGPSMWLWGIGAILVLAVIGLIALFVFRNTTITVTPRTQTIVFDATKNFTAYPSSGAAAGALTYTVQIFDLDESQAVPSTGSSHAEHKASGSVTVVNEYSTTPVRLLKTTRFQTPDGLIFRAPADITVPGMKGTAAGTVDVTLVADEAGQKYNIAPSPRFTLPGLKGGDMFNKVYARSSGSFSGGFSGEEARVSENDKNAAITAMKNKLQEKMTAQIQSAAASGGMLFPSLATVTYTEMPQAPATTPGQITLNERAHVQIPVFPSSDLNRAIASSVSADAENANITLIAKQGFGATLTGTSTSYGGSPVAFSLTGTAQLVWDVDTNAISQALAGKDQSAFQTVINGFPGVQEARARIEPFWQHTFPMDPKKIQVVVSEPSEVTNP